MLGTSNSHSNDHSSRFIFLLRICLFAFVLLKAFRADAVRTREEIERSKVLRFCHVVWFGDTSKSARPGPEVELAVAFANSLGLKPQPKAVLWNEFFFNDQGKVEKEMAYEPSLFKTNKCDLYAANMTVNSWREKKLNIVPYHAGRIMIVVRKGDAAKFRKLEDLNGKSTIVTPNSTLQAELEKAKAVLKRADKDFELRTTVEGGTDKYLIDRKVDFIALDTSQALQVIKRTGGEVTIAFPIGDNQSIGWGFSKSSSWLQAKFVNFIDAQRSQNKSVTNKIFESYYGVSLSTYQDIVQNAQQAL